MSDTLNVEIIKKETEATKKTLETRRGRKPPMSQRMTLSVSALLNYCNRTLFLCKQIEIRRDELRKIKLEIQRVKEVLEQ